MTTEMTKDRLAAFVDGELSPEEAAAVAMHLAGHPADQAWVDDLFAANEALARAFAAPLHEPVPEAIRVAILGPAVAGNVVPYRRRLPLAFGGVALAASVVVAVALFSGLTQGPVPARGIALGPLPNGDPVAMALDLRASGVAETLPDGRKSMVLASFILPDGRFCREFEMVDTVAGRVDYAVGCRAAEAWVIEAAIAEVADIDPLQGFVPAGAAETDALAGYLARSGPPTLLDPAAEASAIRHHWSPP